MNRLYFYRSLITRIRQYLISKSGTNPVTLTNAVEDKLLQGFSITGNSQQSGTPSVESPSPIKTTELKKSSNLLHTDYFNEPKTSNGVTIQYLADDDCFLFNGTATATGSITDTAFLISNANNKPFTISAFYVSGNITVPTGAYAITYIAKKDEISAERINFMSTDLRQNNTNQTKVCDKEYVNAFWFHITAGVTFDNYKVKISVTKLENSFDISKVQTTSNITNNGDSLLITPPGTSKTSTTAQTLSDTCPEIEVGDNVIVNLTLTNDAGVYNAFSSFKAYIYLTVSQRTFVAGSQYTITRDDLNSNIVFYAMPYGSPTPTENKSTITNISISKIPTNYENYGKYGLEIKQEKNILDLYQAKNEQFMTVTEQSENKVVATANNDSSILPVLKLFNQLIPAGNYVLSYTVNIENTPQLQSGSGDRRNEMLIFVGGTFKTKKGPISQDGTYTNSVTFTLQSSSMVDIRWYRNTSGYIVTEDTTYKVTFTNVQLEQGTEVSTYTPYQLPKYNRVWIDKPFLGKTDILTYDGTNLKIVKKEFKINLKDDVVWSYIEPTESGSMGTIKGIVNSSADLYRTILSNTSQTYLCTHYDSSFFDISREHIDDGTAISIRNTVLTFNGLQTDYDSFMEVINTGNVEMLIKYVSHMQTQFTRTITSSSYIDLQPLSAGNNTLTVTNEISPTSCQYKYYSDKEN